MQRDCGSDRHLVRPLTIWFTGLSGAGKSTLAGAYNAHLRALERPSYVLDGDAVRSGLNADLGFAPDSRRENIRRVAHVARLMNDAGLTVIAALISPMKEDRDMARQIVGNENFVEIHLSTSLETCVRRDPKGLYEKARRGEITSFTGISAPYEIPEAPDVRLDTGTLSLAASLAMLDDYITNFGRCNG